MTMTMKISDIGGGDRTLQATPTMLVLGTMDGSYAVRLGWSHGVSVISAPRLQFLKEDLGLAVLDNPDEYVLLGL